MSWVDDGFAMEIVWGDGHVSRLNTTYLRKICPCATCRGTHAAPPLSAAPARKFSVLSDRQLLLAKNEIHVERAYPVGNYAIGFLWSDGHNEGIYTFPYLRQMCPSPQNALRVDRDDAQSA
jgi:DUF971 family protein